MRVSLDSVHECIWSDIRLRQFSALRRIGQMTTTSCSQVDSCRQRYAIFQFTTSFESAIEGEIGYDFCLPHSVDFGDNVEVIDELKLPLHFMLKHFCIFDLTTAPSK